jgi:hypothetical protein
VWKAESRLPAGPTIVMQAWLAVPHGAPAKRGGTVYALFVQAPKDDPRAAEIQRVFDAMVASVRLREPER